MSLRATEKDKPDPLNATSNFGNPKAESESINRLSSIKGTQLNSIILSQFGGEKNAGQEVVQAVNVLQQSLNDKRVTMRNVSAPDQNYITFNVGDIKEEDSDSSNCDSAEQNRKQKKDGVQAMGSRSASVSKRKDVSPGSIPKAKVMEYGQAAEENKVSQFDTGESNFLGLSRQENA